MSSLSKINKIRIGIDVFHITVERINWVFDTFAEICLPFSGGKDSTVLSHLVTDIARRKKRRFSVLLIDWEAQYLCIVRHVQEICELYMDVTELFYWVALPLTVVDGVSQFQPEWICRESGMEWVRQPPDCAVTDPDFFLFYRYAITFEEFIPAFSSWMARSRRGLMVLIGVRADESLNRFMGLASQHKLRYMDDKPWTTASQDGFYYTMYPLYDRKTRDIWVYNGKTYAIYNPLYDLMFRAGISLRNIRICEPFGPEQRKGLRLYHVLEPETWARMCTRVSGVASGTLYTNESGAYFAPRKRTPKPDRRTWCSYAMFSLNVMPEKTAEHYQNRIAVYLHWYQTHGYPDDIPDEQDDDLESRDVPSWRRICKTLIKNDFWCRTLSFSPNKPRHYERYQQRMRKRGKE